MHRTLQAMHTARPIIRLGSLFVNGSSAEDRTVVVPFRKYAVI